MSFSYTPGGGSRDRIRFWSGDTNSDAIQRLRLENEEIDDALVMEPNELLAGATCCDALAAKFAREPEGSAGPHSIRPSSRASELRTTAARLRQRAAGQAGIFAGGLASDDNPRAFEPGKLSHPEAS